MSPILPNYLACTTACRPKPRWRTQTIEDSDGQIPTDSGNDELWQRVRSKLAEGNSVTGTVICRRPFGVFLDIGYGSDAAALLLVPEFTDAHIHPYDLDEYPAVGDSVTALIRHISWDDHKIALTQNQTYDRDSQTWTRPERGVR